MTRDKFKEQFASAAAAAFQKIYSDKYKTVGNKQVFSSDFIYENLETPKDPSMGRFALPVFKFVQMLGDKPPQITLKIADEMNRILQSIFNGPAILETKAVGPYLNAIPNFLESCRGTLKEIIARQEDYGSSDIGQGLKVLLEYSSPNIAKPFGVGHLRSTAIGNSLRKIFKALGYEAIGINFLGDWGTQFGKMIVAYRKWGTKDTLTGNSVTNLLDLYVRFHEEAEKNPKLEDEAREAFKLLEDGDKTAVELWQKFKDLSQAEFNRIYQILGVEYDWVTGEAFLNDKMDKAINRLEKDKLTQVSKGALIVDLNDPQLPPVLLKKADGATLYATRDIAGLLYRWEKYHFHESIYVVGVSQSDHFKQIFKVMELMEEAERLPKSEKMSGRIKHVEFGWVKFGEKTMSTRRGNIIILEDVIDKAVELAKEKIKEKNPDLKDLNETAQMIGVGAVIFSQISVRRHKDVNFDWDEVLNFEGETGPYLQYTHARLCSLLRNYQGKVSSEVKYELLDKPEETAVINLLEDFPQAIAAAARNYDPVFISTHLLKLSSAFNKVYQRKDNNGRIDKIISDNKELTAARIALVKAVQMVVKKGLSLLGLRAPEEM
ncbi:MAG: arginine--tRNA ligase [Candidatus Zixiibacteriota bacterium]